MRKKRPVLETLYRQFDKVLVLFFLLFLFMEGIWIPFSSLVSDFLLQQTGFLYLSYTNAVAVMLASPLVALALLLVFLLNLLLVYWQMGTIVVGIHELWVKGHETLPAFLRATAQESLRVLKQARLSKILFVLLYASGLFPFLRRILKIYYLNKLLIPEFILEYISRNSWVALLLLAFSILAFWLSTRLMFTLPQIFCEGRTVREAIAYSVAKTHRKFWRSMWRLMWLTMKVTILCSLVIFMVIVTQSFADQLDNAISFYAAVANYVFLEFCYYAVLVYFLLAFVAFSYEEGRRQEKYRRPRLVRLIAILTMSAGIFTLQAVIYLQFPTEKMPLTISHRGVDQANGVQNTLEALELTAKLKPDLIEMDIQETKDHEFVMMHDANLKELAGVDGRPQDFTLAELTALEVSENGHQAKIPSFEAYLERADELGQKLLIEIKTSPKDSPEMMKRFLEKYGKIIEEKGHQMHSLDYHVVESVLESPYQIPVFFILPYNTIFPQTSATGYTMEYSTLDENFILKALFSQKEVYDWTVNDEETIERSLHLGVNGIITDELSLLKESLETYKKDRSYLQMLTLRMVDMFNF
ncbi:glycerophosphodiester phosphodiesterase [Streptococcus pneumoniae]